MTPSTRAATSAPKPASTSARVAVVSSTVSCSSARLDGRAVQAQAGGDARAAQGVRDEGLARVAQLGAVVRLGVGVGAPDRVAIDVGVVLGDLRDDLLQLGDTRRESEIEVCKILRHM